MLSDMNLPARKMKDYFIPVGKSITSSNIQERENLLLFVKGGSRIASFIFILIFLEFRVLLCYGTSQCMTLYNMSLLRIGKENNKNPNREFLSLYLDDKFIFKVYIRYISMT